MIFYPKIIFEESKSPSPPRGSGRGSLSNVTLGAPFSWPLRGTESQILLTRRLGQNLDKAAGGPSSRAESRSEQMPAPLEALPSRLLSQ